MIAVKQNDIDAVRVLVEWNCRLDIVGRCRIRGEQYDDLEDFELDPFELSIHQGFWDIVQVMILSGYNVSRISYLREAHEDMPLSLPNNRAMLNFLKQCASVPKPLLQICTEIIFKSIKENISHKIDLLPLQASIRKYLKLYFSGKESMPES